MSSDQCNCNWVVVATVVIIAVLSKFFLKLGRISSLSSEAFTRLHDQIVLVTGASSGLGEGMRYFC